MLYEVRSLVILVEEGVWEKIAACTPKGDDKTVKTSPSEVTAVTESRKSNTLTQGGSDQTNTQVRVSESAKNNTTQ